MAGKGDGVSAQQLNSAGAHWSVLHDNQLQWEGPQPHRSQGPGGLLRSSYWSPSCTGERRWPLPGPASASTGRAIVARAATAAQWRGGALRGTKAPSGVVVCRCVSTGIRVVFRCTKCERAPYRSEGGGGRLEGGEGGVLRAHKRANVGCDVTNVS